MANKIIEIKDLNKTYYGNVETKVLFDMNLSFNQGSFCSIIGQSGSGKSTLMNILGTLDTPTSGKLFLDGNRTDKMKKDELADLRNKLIGFVFQFHYLLPEFTVLENVLMPAKIANKKADKKTLDRAKELLDLVGVANRMDNLATQISGGQQQRVAIARALINTPSILLADEPTGNLDSESTDNIYKLFCRLNREFDMTLLIITHDDRIAERTDRTIEIRDGKIIMDQENENPSCPR